MAKSSFMKGEYDNCIFKACNFSDSDLTGAIFLECEFDQCNFTNTNITDVVLQEIRFKDSKLLGINFSNCKEFLLSFDFQSCQLDLSSFHKLKLKQTRFSHCSLKEVDFVETDLTGASFDNCDLNGAVFEKTNLEKADFTTAINYAFDPELNRIRNARFSLQGLPGLLQKFDISVEQGF